jgi:choline kinase
MVRDIIGAFLSQEWPSVDPESLKMSHRVNFANAHCLVERLNTTSGVSVEPLRVFIKFHEETEPSIDIFNHLAPTKEQEALLCHAFAQLQLGYGAKVLGFFQTEDGTLGRIDEFLDACNMEPEDVEHADIRTGIAKAMANFSAMKSSVPETPVTAYYDAVVPGLQRYHKLEKLKTLAKDGGISMDSLVDYDFTSRIKIVVDAMEAIKARAGWCIHDVQFMNTMVKNCPRPNENKVVLIDFELVMRNFRGFDIGGHFMQKMFK